MKNKFNMENINKINQLQNTLREVCVKHPQIEAVHIGNIEYLSALNKGNQKDDLKYPYVFWIINTISTADRVNKVNLNCILTQRYIDDEDSRVNSQLSLISIMNEIVFYFKNKNDKYWFIENPTNYVSTATPFEYQYEDNVVGITFSLDLTSQADYVCAFPIEI